MSKNKVLQKINRIVHMPPRTVFRQIRYRVKADVRCHFYFFRDKILPTRNRYRVAKRQLIPLPFDLEQLDFSQIPRESAAELWRMYQNHRFDLLGSGWVKNAFLNSANGFEGYRYDAVELKTDADGEFLKEIMLRRDLKQSRAIWRQIGEGYEAIDWQKDYKSGYRWSAKNWYRPQANARKPGGDIKVPWELGRLQHLPRLAVLAAILPKQQAEIAKEFVNEILDFIAQNPVRMGVNYMCTMDVGIRAANLALAYSLMKKQGIRFKKEFENIICNSIFEHCNHIEKNLEWSESYTSNHYFADLAGLLYGAALLPECDRKTHWLTLAVREIKKEILKQFYPEGTNREGSTAYHRLTSEMALYSVALIHALSLKGQCEDAGEEIYRRLYGACRFEEDITKPDGTFSQIGDNDSGLFFRLSITGGMYPVGEILEKYKNLSSYHPVNGEEFYLDENLNDGRTLIAAGAGMFQDDRFKEAQRQYPLEASLIRAWMGEKGRVSLYQKEVKRVSFDYESLRYRERSNLPFPRPIRVESIRSKCYPQFGLYLYRGEAFYLCICMTDNGQNGNAGHAHNDKLSFELSIGGENLSVDSGTYVYTAVPEERDRFRSTRAHHGIDTGKEQNDFVTLFSMKDESRCTVIECNEQEFIGMVRYKDCIHCRKFVIGEGRLMIEDYCNKPFTVKIEALPVTYGYGKLGGPR